MTINTEREWLSVAEFRIRHPQLGKNLVYEAVRSGRLLSIKVHGKILIASDALNQLAAATQAGHGG